jgi:DNA invertase Pin-like site-specific DNA recombinase
VIYARVSSKEQEKEGFSIPAQLKLLRDYAAANGFVIAAEYTDSETAKVAGRTQFGQMLQNLKCDRSIQAVLVEKTDRLYRNIKDWVKLDEFDVQLHFVKEGQVLSRESGSSAKFMHGVRVLMAKNYCDNLSEEVRKGLGEKAAQGLWPHRAPVGYVNDTTTHSIVPDPQKATFVKELFEKYATGSFSLVQLTGFAKASGLFSRNIGTINKAGIHRILTNPIYSGEFEWKGKRYLGKYEPIVSRKLFDQVQDILSGGRCPSPSVNEFAFAGMVRCGLCGCTMTAEVKKGKYVYYHCTGYRGKCGNTYVRQEVLDQLFAEAVGRLKVHSNVVEDIKSALLESQRDRIQFEQESKRALQKRQVRMKSLLDRAYEDKLTGTISSDLWERKSREWQDELVGIGQQLNALESASRDYYQLGLEILELANSAYGMYLAQEWSEKAKLLRTVLSNSTFDRGTLTPTYKKPFDILAEGANFESMRG